MNIIQAINLSSRIFQMNHCRSSGLILDSLRGSMFMYSISRGMAGHSKWSNIRHVKAEKDGQRQKLFSKYLGMMRIAIKEGGSPDPKLNSQLRRVVELAKSNDMPSATIQSALKSHQKSQDNAKHYILEYKGPGKVFFLAEIITDRLKHSKHLISALIKKLNVTEVKGAGSSRRMFDEKGVIISGQGGLSYEEAMDNAIEIGAEDVTQEDDIFVFTCAPDDFFSVKKSLESLNLPIKSADIQFLPSEPVTVSDQEMEQIAVIIEKIESVDDVMKVHVNV